MNGQVIKAVDKNAAPSCAPAIEYVAISDGSSAVAPVINPGPSSEKNCVTRLRLLEAVFVGMPQSFRLVCFGGQD